MLWLLYTVRGVPHSTTKILRAIDRLQDQQVYFSNFFTLRLRREQLDKSEFHRFIILWTSSNVLLTTDRTPIDKVPSVYLFPERIFFICLMETGKLVLVCDIRDLMALISGKTMLYFSYLHSPTVEAPCVTVACFRKCTTKCFGNKYRLVVGNIVCYCCSRNEWHNLVFE